MLDPMDLHRLQSRDGSSDCVRSNVCLSPMSAPLEVYRPSTIASSWISLRLNDESGWIREYHHGAGFRQEDSCLLQGRLSGREQFGELGATMNEFRFRHQACLASLNRNVMSLRTLPGSSNNFTHRVRCRAVLNKLSPCPLNFQIVHHRSSTGDRKANAGTASACFFQHIMMRRMKQMAVRWPTASGHNVICRECCEPRYRCPRTPSPERFLPVLTRLWYLYVGRANAPTEVACDQSWIRS